MRDGGRTRSALAAMPATQALLTAVRRRLAMGLSLEAISAGLLLGTAVAVVLGALGTRAPGTSMVAGTLGVALAAAIAIRGWSCLALVDVAAEIERRVPGIDNLLITAVELGQRDHRVHPLIIDELQRQTDLRVQALGAPAVAPLRRPATLAVVVASGAALVWWGGMRGEIADRMAPGTSEVAVTTEPQQPTITIEITPPSYTSLPQRTLQDVAEVEALQGSRIRIELSASTASPSLVEAGHAPIAFQRSDDSHWLELTAERTRFLLIRAGGPTPDRLLALLVKPDAAPIVRIRRPARDLVFPEPQGRVAIDIEATDDLGLASLSLRYTRVFGSGESTTFQEGDLPLRVERVDRGQWRATSEISLQALQLADGDTLVYRAVTRDLRPGRDPSSSETYLLEVGKLAEAASAGFALPADKERQALSQQMLIVKTERLHAERDKLSRGDFEERARLLAVEQRMVRAEFVFMTGGEVEDEVAEAEHSHELAEGRFENEGQVELLTAIREMSRAEARLNEAATEPALGFERAALKALQRAFDRRRYLLRTTPERARIDQTRRLTGTLTDARSWRRPSTPTETDGDLARIEGLARELAAAKHSAADLGPLAAQLGNLDPASVEIQQAALRLSAAGASESTRAAAIDQTLQLLADRARKALLPARAWVTHDPTAGRYADALAKRGGRR